MTEILQYVQKDSFLHRLAPLTKILFVIIVGMMSVISTSILFLTCVILVLLVISFIAGLHREVLRQFLLIAVMSIILIFITVITLPGGETLFVIGGIIPVTTGGLLIGIIMTLRFAVLITAIQLFVLSTQPRDLVHTLERLKVPVDYTLMFVIALRFIPTLQIEGHRIHEAQLARGYNPGSGIGGKIRSIAPVMVPLVSNSLARSNVLGLTIDLRGYRTKIRTPLRERHLMRLDYAVISVLVVVSAAFIYSTLFLPAW
jgi:energy-coupling factor transport system permease protein